MKYKIEEMSIKTKALKTGLFLVVITGIMLTACDPSKKWEKEEQEQINNFLMTRGDTIFELKPSGLYYYNINEGTGLDIQLQDTISIRYKVWLLSYYLFDSNVDLVAPIEFIVGSGYVIEGIDEGVQYMRKGGKAKMITPSALAYGASGYYPYLSGYTPLVWEIEVVEVLPGPGR